MWASEVLRARTALVTPLLLQCIGRTALTRRARATPTALLIVGLHVATLNTGVS